ncbi:MAG: hypothetical protein J5973_05335, partial [Eubacterium sp.]|nr:hypothetical protein [Eubacterium sp.]
MKQSMISEFADILGTTVEYLVCGVIKTPELHADSVELLKLFGAMDEKTRQIMLVQMRPSCKILIFWRARPERRKSRNFFEPS